MRKWVLTVAAALILLTGCQREADIYGTGESAFDSDIQQEATLAPTLKPEESNFRNLRWGMTEEEVIATEGAGYERVDQSTIRYTRIREEEYPADAEYTFTDDALSGAMFFIQPGYEDKNEYIRNYADLIQRFTQRYGEPMHSSKDWSSENLEDQPELYAQAVLDGNLIWRTEWENQDTAIKLVLFRRGTDICIGIKYDPV